MSNGIKNILTVLRVLLARLRFVAVFVVAAVVVGKWDLIVNRLDQWTRPAVANDSLSGESASDVEYYCPMDGAVEDHPGPCPNCGMPLVKRKKSMNGGLPANVMARVQLTPQRLELANIATTPVIMKMMSHSISAVGVIDYDQTRLFDLAARVAGRADSLYVNYIGQSIKAGDPLYSLYSPDLYTAMREYLQARQHQNQMAKQPGMMADEMADSAALLAAAQNKLVLWGVTQGQLDSMAMQFDMNGQVPTHLDVLSTSDGVVIRKELRQGGYVAAGDVPFAVADLSTVWLNAKIYESDVASVHVGQKAEVSATAWPDRMFHGKVTFLAYQLDPNTRTLDARVEIENPDLALRPQMFAMAMIQPPAMQCLSVPRSAVIDTGESKIVYVQSAAGVFDMRAVKVGPAEGEDYPVLSGLNQGDQVVTRGTFLIDAENHLNPAAAN